MSSRRRNVLGTEAVFAAIDSALPAARGPDGQPSADDFLRADLLPIISTFQDRFEALPEAEPGRGDYRVFVGTGLVVRAFAVIGHLVSDEVIELVYLAIDND